MRLGMAQQGILSTYSTSLNLWGDIESAWEFDGDTTDISGFWKDEVGNHHIIAGTTPTKQVGVVGDARGGTGSTQRMHTGSFAYTAQDMTFMGWFNPHSGFGNGWGWFVKFGEGFGDNHFRILKNEPLTIIYGVVVNNGVSGAPAYPAATAGTWMHLVFTYVHATGTWACYRNGLPNGGGATGKYMPSGSSFNLEFCYVPNSAYSGGIIDAVRWFNRALTPAEAAAHYNGGAGLAYLET